MFFSWFIHNRHFKQGSNLSGQITPFLLVILVVLLIAAISTINIGRVGVDKTYSGNAADAGALGSASVMAGLFNWLCEANKEMRDSYDVFYEGQYHPVYLAAEDDLNEAIVYAAAAASIMLAATIYAQALEVLPCPVKFPWDYYFMAALCTAAAYLCYEAFVKTMDFNVDISMLISIVESFHENQWEYYCTIRKNSDKTRDIAEETGYSLAFSNSGISPKLSAAQQDDFSAWMSHKGSASGTYSWEDKVGGAHSVSVNVSVPQVENYILWHTYYPYSKVKTILEEILEDSQLVATILYSMSIMLGLAAAAWWMVAAAITWYWIVFFCCLEPWGGWCCANLNNACSIVVSLQSFAKVYTEWIGLILGLLLVVGAVWGALNLYSLRDENDDAFYGVGGPDEGKPLGSITCKDAEDLLIVQIWQVPYPGDTSVSTSQQHPGISYGIMRTSYPTVSSSASASYDGGHIGKFSASYDTRLTSAN